MKRIECSAQCQQQFEALLHDAGDGHIHWLGPRDGKGRALFNAYMAHRVAWFLENDQQPGYLKRMCPDPLCISPVHWQQRSAPEPRKNKLSSERRQQLMDRLDDFYWGQTKQLADEFGVSSAYVSKLRRLRPGQSSSGLRSRQSSSG